MSKKVIAILSVLKPVDDTRNLEKIATSLGNTNKYDINIIGFSAKNLPDIQNITYHPIFNFRRTSTKRLKAPFQIFRLLLKLKPELIIVTCVELLLVTCAYKILFGTRIIYDIQENYYRNIIYTSTYPKLFRHVIGITIRSIEWLTSPFIDWYFLAEKVYQKQLKFTGSKFEVIENKAVIPSMLNPDEERDQSLVTFLYSGTIATHYGIFDAVKFIKQLYEVNKNIEFRVVGFAPDHQVFESLVSETQGCDYITIVGGDKLITHSQVLKEIVNADFCLLPYQANKSTEGRLPTKLFECLALEIPVIISPNPIWNSMIAENNAGVIHDFQSDSIPVIINKKSEYYGNLLCNKYLWNQEENKVLNIVHELI